MTFEQKDNTGTLFANEKKKDNIPDYSGKFLIHGDEFQVSGWIKVSKKGINYISLSFRQDNKNTTQSYRKPNPVLTNHDSQKNDSDPF